MSELIDINKVITCLDFAIDAINHECYNDALSSINEAKEAYNTHNEWIPVPDNFGCQQLIKDILPNVHMIDIRIRMDGQYYWFEGDFLKRILPYVKFNRVELDINCKLENHREE